MFKYKLTTVKTYCNMQFYYNYSYCTVFDKLTLKCEFTDKMSDIGYFIAMRIRNEFHQVSSPESWTGVMDDRYCVLLTILNSYALYLLLRSRELIITEKT